MSKVIQQVGRKVKTRSYYYFIIIGLHGTLYGNPLQYSCLKNLMDRGAWWATLVHGVTKSRTRLSDFTKAHY